MRLLRRLNRSWIAMFHDATMAGLSFLAAVYLRLGSEGMVQAEPYLLSAVLLFTLVSMLVFVQMRLYRGIWRFASVEDLMNIVRAVSLAVLVFAFLLFFISRLEGLPRSVLVINWMLLIGMLGAPRFAYRVVKDKAFTVQLQRESSAIPLLLMGAGEAAERFVRETLRGGERNYRVVGIIDDDPARKDRTLHGVRIYGGSDALAVILDKLVRKNRPVQRIILTEPTTPEQLERWAKIADEKGVSLSRLPRMDEFDHRLQDRRALRPVAIEDLLGRPQVVRDKSAMQAFVQGKTLLVTGAGGSIGSELCRQLVQYDPKTIIFFEQSEFALYTIDQEISRLAPEAGRVAVLGDVRNGEQIDAVMAAHKPDMVFHAAAIKHVPLAEDNPIEAVQTNVLGTGHVLAQAAAHHAAMMVTISTDKAVHPTNVMGATKRLAEKVFLHRHPEGPCPEGSQAMQRVAVRFGNVLGSAGSVVPLFQQQLRAGGPLTVTHPDMLRYFMTIREAVDLVLQAARLSFETHEQKALYVLDMGKPVKIVDLARRMISLAGLVPDKEIAIEFTGLRPGEKLYEELFYEAENPQKTTIDGVLKAHLTTAKEMHDIMEPLATSCQQRDQQSVLAALKNAVPEYQDAPASSTANDPARSQAG